jgi:hypothetical protein
MQFPRTLFSHGLFSISGHTLRREPELRGWYGPVAPGSCTNVRPLPLKAHGHRCKHDMLACTQPGGSRGPAHTGPRHSVPSREGALLAHVRPGRTQARVLCRTRSLLRGLAAQVRTGSRRRGTGGCRPRGGPGTTWIRSSGSRSGAPPGSPRCRTARCTSQYGRRQQAPAGDPSMPGRLLRPLLRGSGARAPAHARPQQEAGEGRSRAAAQPARSSQGRQPACVPPRSP